MSFHQVHECSRAVHDGSRTVHEPVLCIGINGYKRSFECYDIHDIFSAFVFPHILVMDNGSQFISIDFLNFLGQHYIIYYKCLLYHMTTNHLTENMIISVNPI